MLIYNYKSYKEGAEMNLLNMENISKAYADKVLFNDITMGINEGDKIGVIGINGTGKSTLLKIISGLEEPDSGIVNKGKNIRIEYLAQIPEFQEELNIIQNVIIGKKAKEDYRNIEGEAIAMLQRLGIEDFKGEVNTLSGGQKKRIALVRTLLTPADILVLDEPTNHLDNEMAQWLEDYLKKYQGALIMVTHDRYFLDRVANIIMEIDKGNLYTYRANYTKFLELKAQREEMEIATDRKKKSLYRKDLEWMMRGARARSTKQKAHIKRFEELSDHKVFKRDKTIELDSVSTRLGKKTIEINNISKSFDVKNLINDFSYILLKNDRIGILGPNGCGKTTLLNIINGDLTPDQGSIDIGETVKIGYFSQETEFIDGNLRVIDYIKNVAEYIQTNDGSVTASQMLERFLFSGSMQYSFISKLSGGEIRRLYLLKILMEAPNILILDEPTNDLDISTLTILEDYLDSFDGIVLTVSHDRYFLDRVINRIFAFEGNGKIRQYEGGFSEYRQSLENKSNVSSIENKPEKNKNQARSKPKPKLKFSYNEQKEYQEIDEIIAGLEDTIQELDRKILEAATDYSKLNELINEKNQVDKKLEEKMERWVYLNDLAEKIEEAKK
jgi:ATP-binding cassette subfamily F protein uup